MHLVSASSMTMFRKWELRGATVHEPLSSKGIIQMHIYASMEYRLLVESTDCITLFKLQKRGTNSPRLGPIAPGHFVKFCLQGVFASFEVHGHCPIFRESQSLSSRKL